VYAGIEGGRGRKKSAVVALILFALTVFSTLIVGTEFAAAYGAGRLPSFPDLDHYQALWQNPRLLVTGIPFSFTVMGILLAHELGHFFACRYYGIQSSYPYFIPAPTLIGTMGAFIRIRSTFVNRTALFDVGIAGPIVGFAFALPAFAAAILFSKTVPVMSSDAPAFAFGNPLLGDILTALLRPGISPEELLLHPVGRAAWVGLFATAMNLLPAGQLDGGHILYALSSSRHRIISRLVSILLVPLTYLWIGWLLWAVLLFALGVRHPPLMDPYEPLDRRRRIWAVVALIILVLCFMPAPIRTL
jgi:membrane-associated protease RseP (regulator of RpoE activity)